MLTLETPRLILREWRAEDRDLFREINRDPKVMEFFAFRRSHAEADVMMDKVNELMRETGFGFYALELKDTGEAMGFCGLSIANIEPFLPPQAIEVGWRLATRFWGHGYVTEGARECLRHGFEDRNLPEIVSFAVTGNTRSRAVMERIGMRHAGGVTFNHPRVPDTHPHLQEHVLYRLSAEDWRNSATT
ncbi:GNAT family N-acetyltransferase [Rhizobium halophytocola]|uniref:RimJ/RimL family protein N-acetyltransferase n=1 Tax=Rhizobium halophytocola TaxID=735519 RepID=A0ABS4E6C7_9HYPH|nr:GNAT family N-acetyltransferase [Rhizobium halophytocola]MBP1853500.1 RimJ/RimL family protein N-acetyltransferase [Rhizobium halophytocola]